MSDLTIRCVTGAAVYDYLPALADLRVRVFREYPYLYDGDTAYENRYLRKYLESQNSLFVLVFDGDAIVGASSGLPMADEAPELVQPFKDRGYEPHRVFYCAESVVLPEYRGQGWGGVFFKEREAFAKGLRDFEWITFCAVERANDHPRRPPDYRPLDAFWQRLGYRKRPELRAEFAWKDLDEAQESRKPMVFWLKAL